MVKINLVCVGKLKERYLTDASAEYVKRLSAFCRLNITEVKEYRICENPSAPVISKTVSEEGKSIFSAMPKKGICVSMCIEGEKLSSDGLSDFIKREINKGTEEITFVIGGSYGLSEEIKQASDLKLSMSDMTFPHQLARVMLLEQIYRAFNILNGGKYHK